MTKQKLLLGISLILIGAVLVGAVCASDVLYLDGINFNIPSGYSELTKYATDGEVDTYSSFTVTSSHRAYSSSSGDYLGITVSEYSTDTPLSTIKSDDDVYKTIGGVRGLYSHDELHFFTYKDGNKIVLISADDYSVIEEVMNK